LNNLKLRKMKNVTQVLSEEHQNILKVINIVLEECEQLQYGKTLDKGFFNDIISFIKNYADGFHHVKEEDILFKTMLNNEEHMHCNPIPVMLNEHDAGRQYVKGMELALSQENVKNLIENAQGYCYLLQNHIYKEDNILYPMAEQGLDEQQKQQIDNSYRKVNAADFFEKNIDDFIKNLENSMVLK